MDFSPIVPPRKKKKDKKRRRHKSRSIASIVSSPDEIKKNRKFARNDNRKKKRDKTEKQLEKFAAVTKQNLDSIGDGRLSLKQKSLNVELAGLFNQARMISLFSLELEILSTIYLPTYFSLPNDSAANLIKFSTISNLQTLITTCTFIEF